MAITKIHPITATLDKAIDYICNPDKTDEKMFISSYACSPETAAIDFKYTLDHCREQGQNKAYHLIQAFAPGEVSFEEAHAIGKELADKTLEGRYSYVITTHIDKGHVHNHIIFCAADNMDFNKYNDCTKSYYHIRKLSDNLCEEHNLSIIEPGGKRRQKYNEWQAGKNDTGWKVQLKKDINQSIKNSSNYEEFLILMKAKGYEIKEGKYIAFRLIGKDRFVRGSVKSLGANFTKERIQERIENKRQQSTSFHKSDQGIRRLIDINNDAKFEESIGLQKWATKENLKIAAKTYSLMTSKNINSFSELNDKISSLQEQSKSAKKSIISLEHRIQDLAEIMKYVGQYKENKPFNDRYEAVKDKDRFFRKYESKIILFGGAERMLQRKNIDPKRANIDKLKDEYKSLIAQKNELNTSHNSYQKEIKELELIRHNMEQYLQTSMGAVVAENETKRLRDTEL